MVVQTQLHIDPLISLLQLKMIKHMVREEMQISEKSRNSFFSWTNWGKEEGLPHKLEAEGNQGLLQII